MFNRLPKETARVVSSKSRADLTRLMLKRKPRLRAKDSQLSCAEPFLKRFSMHIEYEPKARTVFGDKKGAIKGLRKKMSVNYSTHEDAKRIRQHRPADAKDPRSPEARVGARGARGAKGKRKTKTLSSNTMAISKLLKNSGKENKRVDSGRRAKPKKKGKTERRGKDTGTGQRVSVAKAKETEETAKPSKPPLLPKSGLYASYNGGVKRGKLKGFVRRKLSMGLSQCESRGHSKRSSPQGEGRKGFVMSPRYFKTLGKKEPRSGKTLDFIPAPKLIRAKRSENRHMRSIEEEKQAPGKTEKLRKMLVRKRNGLLTKHDSNVSISAREVRPATGLGQKAEPRGSGAELKTPVNEDRRMAGDSPLKRREQKRQRGAKNLFSFNKDSERDTGDEGPRVPNNTSLLYSCALNSSRTQNSFIMLKNRIGGGKASLAKLGQSVHFRVDSLKNGSILAREGHSRANKSFMQRVRNQPVKKRSKSFFEVDKQLRARTNPDFLESAERNNLSTLGLQGAGNTSQAKSSDSDQLSQFIESMQKQREQVESVGTIREESEASADKRYGPRWKRPPTLEGIDEGVR